MPKKKEPQFTILTKLYYVIQDADHIAGEVYIWEYSTIPY